jgi:hypothetical protein
MSDALRHDRLIDLVLDIDSYAEDVDVDWIASNITYWGVADRLPLTLIVELNVLANQPAEDRQRASLILDILVVNSSAAPQAGLPLGASHCRRGKRAALIVQRGPAHDLRNRPFEPP